MTTRSTRDHLIEVGVQLMHAHGYGATGMSEILAAADVPKGSFYHHFRSKEEFATAVLETYATNEAAHVEKVMKLKNLSPLEQLRRYFRELVRIYGQKGPIPGCMIATLSTEVANTSTGIQHQLSGVFQHWQQALASWVRACIESGEIASTFDPDTLAAFLLNSWEGAVVRSMADQSDKPLENYLHYVFDVLLAAKPAR